LRNVVSVQSTSGAFAALRSDGTVVAWGDPRKGGDLSDVQVDLHAIQRLQACARSFAALRADGSVVVWPCAGRGFHSALVDSTACSFRKEVQGSKGGRRVDFGDGRETFMGDGPRFH